MISAQVRKAEERAAAAARWRERTAPKEPEPASSSLSGQSAPLPGHPTFLGGQSINAPLPPHQLGPPRKPRKIRLGAGDEMVGG